MLSVIAVLFTLPEPDQGRGRGRAPLAKQARQLLHQEVWLTYLTIAIIMVGQLAFGTFQVAMLTEVTGLSARPCPVLPA